VRGGEEEDPGEQGVKRCLSREGLWGGSINGSTAVGEADYTLVKVWKPMEAS
jgi:hypothetical protein